jgi:pimeloyl-ACP methyl ester carboxylesterase
MAPEAALRRNLANALAPATVAAQPQLVDRLVAEQRDVPAGGAGLRAQVAAGARFGALRQASITARTLILQGGADRVVDPRNARRLADRIPGAQLIVFPELGHLFFREDPALFVRTVTRFALSGRVP